MGVEPFLLASTPARRARPAPGAPAVPGLRTRRAATDADRAPRPARPPACGAPRLPACGRTGYAGRTGIYELITTDDAIERPSTPAPTKEAGAPRPRPRRPAACDDDGLRLVAEGATSAEELLRVTARA